MRVPILLASASLVLASLTTAQTVTVPSPTFPTISSAIASVPPGGTLNVLVLPGTYLEEPVISGINITLLGTGGPAQTTLSGLGLNPWNSTLTITGSAVVSVSGFTFRDGWASHGGAIRVNGGATATITGNVFTANEGALGGAIHCAGPATATITDNTISGNNASLPSSPSFGGGIHIEATATAPVSVLVQGNDIRGNVARNAGGNGGSGGAIHVLNTGSQSVVIDANAITGNIAHVSGGGISVDSSDAMITANTITENRADISGGGISVDSSDAMITANTITENRADVSGGGISVVSSDGMITGNAIENNFAFQRGAGIDVVESGPIISGNDILANGWPIPGATLPTDAGGGIAVHGDGATPLQFSDNEVVGNLAGSFGGGIYAYSASPILLGNRLHANGGVWQMQVWPTEGGAAFVEGGAGELRDNSVLHNEARWAGGGIVCWNSAANVVQNVIAKNVVADGIGGGLVVYGTIGFPSATQVRCNTMALNVVNDPQGVGGKGRGGSVWTNVGVELWNCILWGSDARTEVDGLATVALHHCVIPSTSGGTWTDPNSTCVFLNPRFVDVALDDFRLKASSPARDMGNNSPPGGLPLLDIGGLTRVVNAIVDVGAHEYQ